MVTWHLTCLNHAVRCPLAFVLPGFPLLGTTKCFTSFGLMLRLRDDLGLGQPGLRTGLFMSLLGFFGAELDK